MKRTPHQTIMEPTGPATACRARTLDRPAAIKRYRHLSQTIAKCRKALTEVNNATVAGQYISRQLEAALSEHKQVLNCLVLLSFVDCSREHFAYLTSQLEDCRTRLRNPSLGRKAAIQIGTHYFEVLAELGAAHTTEDA